MGFKIQECTSVGSNVSEGFDSWQDVEREFLKRIDMMVERRLAEENWCDVGIRIVEVHGVRWITKRAAEISSEGKVRWEVA